MLASRIRPASAAFAASLLVALALAAPPQPVRAGVNPAAGAHSFVTVMTRNLDEGTDFGYIVRAAQGLMSFPAALSATYQEVLESDVCGRAARIADEIATAQPDLVSIQEAAMWTGPLPAGCAGAASATTIDAEAALMRELALDGASYHVVAAQDEFSSAVIAPLLPPGLSFLDRDLLLARDEPPNQLTLTDVQAHHFSTLLSMPLAPGLAVPIPRGWLSVDATVRGRTARFIATHLESFYQPVQQAQAMELAAGPADTPLPVILGGDLNTGPGSAQVATYDWLTSATGGAFTDTWAVTNPDDPGFTDNFYTEDPKTPSVPSERIDLVLVRNTNVPFGPKDYLVGEEIPHPSDHAGVVAKVTIV